MLKMKENGHERCSESPSFVEAERAAAPGACPQGAPSCVHPSLLLASDLLTDFQGQDSDGCRENPVR